MGLPQPRHSPCAHRARQGRIGSREDAETRRALGHDDSGLIRMSRHCEQSEAIQSHRRYWIASLRSWVTVVDSMHSNPAPKVTNFPMKRGFSVTFCHL